MVKGQLMVFLRMEYRLVYGPGGIKAVISLKKKHLKERKKVLLGV
jgi:hypothetical protein